MSTDFETQQQTIETAAERDFFYWKGQRLEPFAFLRQSAAQRIMKEDAGMLENACLLVYLCTLQPSEIDPVRGSVEIAAFRVRLSDWADRERITLVNCDDIVKLANEIWNEVEAASHKAVAKPGPTEAPPKNE